MIKADCIMCSEEIMNYAALLFGPPSGFGDSCLKIHLCKPCYQLIFDYIVKKSTENQLRKRIKRINETNSKSKTRKNKVRSKT